MATVTPGAGALNGAVVESGEASAHGTAGPDISTGAGPSMFQRRRRRRALTRGAIFLVLGAFFAIPMLSMVDFSTKLLNEPGRSFAPWTNLWADTDLRSAVVTSLILAALTVAMMLLLLLPTMIWVRLRLPWANRALEFVSLLPLTIPALVLVVGLGPVYAWVTYLLGDSPLTLSFAYVILVLPYAYRALDAGLSSLDIKTLSDAARSLGAGYSRVILQVVIPNVMSSVLSASFVAVALVLGEYTVASLLSFDNLQVVVALLGKSDAQTSVAASLATLLLAFVLLFGLSFMGRRRSSQPVSISPEETTS